MRNLMLAGGLVLAACGPSISTVATNPSPRPLAARSVDSVEVYTTKLPARSYVEVAVFTASKGRADEHIDALRERAASYGCDALVFSRMPGESTSSSTTATGGTSQTTTTTAVGSSSATCVVWNEPASPPAMSAAPATAAQ